MMSIQDERGYNQIFRETTTTRVRTKRRNNYFAKNIDDAQPHRILEIGCGLGGLSGLLAQNSNNQVTGIDLSRKFIEEARKKYHAQNIQFHILDFYNSKELPQQHFDYVVGTGILHHLYPRLDEALSHIYSLLKNQGRILFLEPNLLNPFCFLIFNTTPFFRKLAKLEPTEKAFTKNFITKKLRKIGFTHISVEYKDFLTPLTPEFLIRPTVMIGDVLEKIPLIKQMSQSIFIRAEKPENLIEG